jgi:hypothetical protein
MLTKLGMTALLGTIGSVAVSAPASAHERWEGDRAVFTPGYYRYENAYQRMMRERRERAMRHARWLHEHRGFGNGNGSGYGYGFGNRW